MELVDISNKVTKKNTRKGYKKNLKKDIQYDLELYVYNKKLDTNYFNELKNIEHLSYKEKINIENKFSKPRNKSQDKFLNYLMNKDYYVIVADDVKFNRLGIINILNFIHSFVILEVENGKEAVDLYAL